MLVKKSVINFDQLIFGHNFRSKLEIFFVVSAYLLNSSKTTQMSGSKLQANDGDIFTMENTIQLQPKKSSIYSKIVKTSRQVTQKITLTGG